MSLKKLSVVVFFYMDLVLCQSDSMRLLSFFPFGEIVLNFCVVKVTTRKYIVDVWVLWSVSYDDPLISLLGHTQEEFAPNKLLLSLHCYCFTIMTYIKRSHCNACHDKPLVKWYCIFLFSLDIIACHNC